MLNIKPAIDNTDQFRVLKHGEHVFHEALSHVPDGEMSFYVRNNVGEDYILEYTQNMDLIPQQYRAYLKMTDGKDILVPYLVYDENDVEKLCLAFFDPFKDVMFEGIDEYAVEVARIILLHTSMDVYFTDDRASWFLPESDRLHIVKILPVNKETKDTSTLYVIPGIMETGYMRKDYSYISSMPLFHNIFFWQWLTSVPLDQIQYVEMVFYKDLGLGAILNRIYSYNRIFGEKGWKAFLSPGTSRYSDALLTKYFNISGKPEDACAGNTILIDNMSPLVTTWHFQQYGQGIEADVFQPEFRRQLDEYAGAVLNGKKALGVLIRGTDYVVSKMPGVTQQASADQMIPLIDQWIEEDGYDILFLATEDQDVYQTMVQHYGKKLRAISQERFAVRDFKDVTLISELEKEINSAEEYEGAVEDTTVNYIYAVYVLSRCDSIIGSGLNNGYNMAVSLNGGKYKRAYQFQVGI